MHNIKKIININLYRYLEYNSKARINYDKYFIDYFNKKEFKNSNLDLYKYFSLPIEERKSYCEEKK
tara:strand:+ start:2321 stop:2518 length:198 start_codon:yes stop_codon:yes gene_type:complete